MPQAAAALLMKPVEQSIESTVGSLVGGLAGGENPLAQLAKGFEQAFSGFTGMANGGSSIGGDSAGTGSGMSDLSAAPPPYSAPSQGAQFGASSTGDGGDINGGDVSGGNLNGMLNDAKAKEKSSNPDVQLEGQREEAQEQQIFNALSKLIGDQQQNAQTAIQNVH